MSVHVSQPIEYEVDRFRRGYPRYAAFLSTHPSFHNFRRFTRVRMRLLLAKQNEISVLERKLDQIDAAEDQELCLGCMQRDTNADRQETLLHIKTAVREYDEMVEQCRKTTALPASSPRDVENLQNWVNGTACLDRIEGSYLDHGSDLMNLSDYEDTSIAYTEFMVENFAFWLEMIVSKVAPNMRIGRQNITEDGHVLLLGPIMQRISRALSIALITIVILAPTVVLLNMTSSTGRVVISILSAALFLSFISFFSRARSVEVFAAGASYAAVLVVFTGSK